LAVGQHALVGAVDAARRVVLRQRNRVLQAPHARADASAARPRAQQRVLGAAQARTMSRMSPAAWRMVCCTMCERCVMYIS
jgi:hypothetical protein